MGSMNVSSKPNQLDPNLIMVQFGNMKNIGMKLRNTQTDSQDFNIDGKNLNEHMHQFMYEVFWFNKTMKPSLRHQSDSPTSHYALSTIYEDYLKSLAFKNPPRNSAQSSWQNSGSLSHKRNNFFELPRKPEPIYSKKDLKPTFFAQSETNPDYGTQRYRRADDGPTDFSNCMCEYDVMELAKEEMKSKKQDGICKEMLTSTHLKKTLVSKKYESKCNNKIANNCDTYGTKYGLNKEENVGNNRISNVVGTKMHQLDNNSTFFDAKSKEFLMRQFHSIIQPLDFDNGRDRIKHIGGQEHIFPAQNEIIYSHSHRIFEQWKSHQRQGEGAFSFKIP
ncbi:Pre-mRNA-splicing factor SLU7 [Thelohanellus kitauei]|uniref:Pre-mRNA-splicing factor SLU7 n=1 Tax=Thelohanellus kitauei TaxID=669202 RepID=A0A0C2MXD2_THEKT|nr:Pre-mRNA-splicing factor SLU7 [Thelohanellus kitauei]